jgi:hypothetical protein
LREKVNKAVTAKHNNRFDLLLALPNILMRIVKTWQVHILIDEPFTESSHRHFSANSNKDTYTEMKN